MAQAPDSTKIAPASSQKVTEKGVTSTHGGETDEQRRIEHTADEMAKRANDRTKSYDDSAPDQQVFTK
jgi:hypothetical protein